LKIHLTAIVLKTVIGLKISSKKVAFPNSCKSWCGVAHAPVRPNNVPFWLGSNGVSIQGIERKISISLSTGEAKTWALSLY